MIYRRQIIDKILPFIPEDEIIVITGARQVGKTSIMLWLKDMLKKEGKPVFFIDLEDSRNRRALEQGPEMLVRMLMEEGFPAESNTKIYVFIDEIQYLSRPAEFLKLAADHHKNLKLIVSGSSSFEMKSKFHDTLTGRTMVFELFPLSFPEFLTFKQVHFPEKPAPWTEKKLQEIKTLYKEFVLTGGYPKIVLTASREMKEMRLQQIIDTYIRVDIKDLAKVEDTDAFNKLLEILASQSGQLLNISELSQTLGMARQTVKRYLFILEQTYVLKLVRPFHRNLRNEVVKTPKIFFYDTGIMQMLWLKYLSKEMLGQVFETAIFGELVKKFGKNHVYFWRSKDKKEIDFIVQQKNQIIPLEVKMNFGKARLTAIKYFMEKYGIGEYYIVGWNNFSDNPHFIYPWEIWYW